MNDYDITLLINICHANKRSHNHSLCKNSEQKVDYYNLFEYQSHEPLLWRSHIRTLFSGGFNNPIISNPVLSATDHHLQIYVTYCLTGQLCYEVVCPDIQIFLHYKHIVTQWRNDLEFEIFVNLTFHVWIWMLFCWFECFFKMLGSVTEWWLI